MEMAPISYAENDGVSIAYTTVGEGPVEMIFVPGCVSHLEIVGELPQAPHTLNGVPANGTCSQSPDSHSLAECHTSATPG